MNIIEDYSTGMNYLDELISSSKDNKQKEAFEESKRAWEEQTKIENKYNSKHGIFTIPQLFEPHFRIIGVTELGNLVINYLTTYDV
jgi:hypothetical protein